MEQIIQTGLIFTRIASFLMGFPLINTRLIPANIKLLTVIAMSFYIVHILGNPVQIPYNLSLKSFTLIVAKELLIGFLLGLITGIFISIFSYASEIIGYSMGLTVANMFDPTFGMVSVIDKFFIIAVYLVFFLTDGYKLFLEAIIASFKLLPVMPPPKINIPLWFIVKKSALLFSLALKISFPFLLSLFIVNLGFALINRLIPQMNIFIIGLPVQILIGLIMLVVGFPVIVYLANIIVNNMVESHFETLKLISR